MSLVLGSERGTCNQTYLIMYDLTRGEFMYGQRKNYHIKFFLCKNIF